MLLLGDLRCVKMASFNIVGEIKTSIFQGCCVGTFHPCQEQKAKRPVNSRTRGKYHAVYSLQGSGCAMLRRLEPAVGPLDRELQESAGPIKISRRAFPSASAA